MIKLEYEDEFLDDLGEECFIFSDRTDKFYKIVGIRGTYRGFYTHELIQECELKLIGKTL